jgi:hypothetical protein
LGQLAAQPRVCAMANWASEMTRRTDDLTDRCQVRG